MQSKTEEVRWPNNNLRKRASYYLSPDGSKVLHGAQVDWHENGNKYQESYYAHSKLDGTSVEWYADGQKAIERNWSHGKECGKWVAWQPTGDKMWEATFVDGKIHGKKTFWSNGKLIGEEDYGDDGVLASLTLLHNNGQKMVHGTFKDGKKHGKWIYWTRDGQVQAEGEWRAGAPWEGLCGIPAAGDAGSVGGIEKFVQHHEGVPVTK